MDSLECSGAPNRLDCRLATTWTQEDVNSGKNTVHDEGTRPIRREGPTCTVKHALITPHFEVQVQLKNPLEGGMHPPHLNDAS